MDKAETLSQCNINFVFLPAYAVALLTALLYGQEPHMNIAAFFYIRATLCNLVLPIPEPVGP